MTISELFEKVKQAILNNKVEEIKELLERSRPPLKKEELNLLMTKAFFQSPNKLAKIKNVQDCFFTAFQFAILYSRSTALYLFNHPQVQMGQPTGLQTYSELDLALLMDDTELTLRLMLEKNAVTKNINDVNKKELAYAIYEKVMEYRRSIIWGENSIDRRGDISEFIGKYESEFAHLYNIAGNRENAAKWYLEASKKNIENTKFKLAVLYLYENDKLGIYKKQNPYQEAVALFREGHHPVHADDALVHLEKISAMHNGIAGEEKEHEESSVDKREAAYAALLQLADLKPAMAKVYLDRATQINPFPSVEEFRVMKFLDYPEIGGRFDNHESQIEFFRKLSRILLQENQIYRIKALLDFIPNYHFSFYLNEAMSELVAPDPELIEAVNAHLKKHESFIRVSYTEGPGLTYGSAYKELAKKNYAFAAPLINNNARYFGMQSPKGHIYAYHAFNTESYCYKQCVVQANEVEDDEIDFFFSEQAVVAQVNAYMAVYKIVNSQSRKALDKAIDIYKRYDIESKEDFIENKFSEDLIQKINMRANEHQRYNELEAAKADFELAIRYGDKAARLDLIKVCGQLGDYASAIKVCYQEMAEEGIEILDLNRLLAILIAIGKYESLNSHVEVVIKRVIYLVEKLFDHPSSTLNDRLQCANLLAQYKMIKSDKLENRFRFVKLEKEYSDYPRYDFINIDNLEHQKVFVQKFCSTALFERANKHERIRGVLKKKGEPERAAVNYLLFLVIKPPYLCKEYNRRKVQAEAFLNEAAGDLKDLSLVKDKQVMFARVALQLIKYCSHIDFYKEVISKDIHPIVFLFSLINKRGFPIAPADVKVFEDRFLENLEKSIGFPTKNPNWLQTYKAERDSPPRANMRELVDQCLYAQRMLEFADSLGRRHSIFAANEADNKGQMAHAPASPGGKI